MRYRLKNKYDQKRIEECLGHSITDRITKAFLKKADGDKSIRVTSRIGNIIVRLDIPVVLVTRAQDYDPEKWNPYPYVDPPEKGSFQVETEDGNGYMAFHNPKEGFTRVSDELEDVVPIPDVVKFRDWQR